MPPVVERLVFTQPAQSLSMRTSRLAGAQCAGATWRRRGVETHHDTAVPEGASPARFEGCREEGTMRYSARVRGTAHLKIARYIKENADEGREEVGREEEGAGQRETR